MRKSTQLILAITTVILVTLISFVGRKSLHHPKPQRPEGLPDYSGITVDRVLRTDLKPGTGPALKAGDRVHLKYRMWIYDPAQLGNHGDEVTIGKDQNLSLTVGKGEVIEGWDHALEGMKAGQQSILVIPADQAYADEGVPGQVPKGAIIQITSEILKIEAKKIEPTTSAKKQKAAMKSGPSSESKVVPARGQSDQ